MGEESGINYMAQRVGAVFALAIRAALFAALHHLGSPAVTAGFRPARWLFISFAVLAALSGIAITSPHRETSTKVGPAQLPDGTRIRNTTQPPSTRGAGR